MIVKNAKYVTSAVKETDFLSDKKEVCFVGRSNVGKSSLINMLVGSKGLAKSSSTPGLTKMVNYFSVNDELYFVDLPGYGFSKTGKKHTELWSSLIENYLLGSRQLKMVFLLVDIRHEPSELDKLMHKFLFYHNIPHKILATKADKVPKSKIINYKTQIAKTLMIGIGNVVAVSETGLGREEVLNQILSALETLE